MQMSMFITTGGMWFGPKSKPEWLSQLLYYLTEWECSEEIAQKKKIGKIGKNATTEKHQAVVTEQS